MKYTLIILLFLPTVLFGQKPSDLELWTGGTVNFKFNKLLSLDVTEQVRFNNNISSYKKSFTQVGLKINLPKGFGIVPAYRFNVEAGGVLDHRLSLDGTYKWDKKGFPLTVGYRMRFQHKFIDTKTYWRNKVKLGWKLSKLVDPFMAYELFFRFNGKNEFRVSRFTVGLDWRITKRFYVSTYYRLQDDIFVKNPERQHIIGLMLDYKFRPKKKSNQSSIE
ncbi:DUF2490 domain-containing protein [Paracrocinitomix mangrovi]|uniref:DUF2490 domain-containing protein n=1 Tax=Paracrocinitomix mangrovi TaxID=2862509 RepID=UPI001C8E9CBE|nr:DUF2490 domain-containing protein [Paracrocinitomix mangrovi]UKN01096.1 DUF2490 domain-containing protein [Paracrocinitomix mangrovi]